MSCLKMKVFFKFVKIPLFISIGSVKSLNRPVLHHKGLKDAKQE